MCPVPTYPWKGYRRVGTNRRERGESEGRGVGEKEKGKGRKERRRRESKGERKEGGRDESNKHTVEPRVAKISFLLNRSRFILLAGDVVLVTRIKIMISALFFTRKS